MKNMILIGVSVLILATLGVIGYLWYVAEKSPSIMSGGYDRDMEKKEMQGEDSILETDTPINSNLGGTPASDLDAPVPTTPLTDSMKDEVTVAIKNRYKLFSDGTTTEIRDYFKKQYAYDQEALKSFSTLSDEEVVEMTKQAREIFSPEALEKLFQAEDVAWEFKTATPEFSGEIAIVTSESAQLTTLAWKVNGIWY
jgi:hypothetical protein